MTFFFQISVVFLCGVIKRSEKKNRNQAYSTVIDEIRQLENSFYRKKKKPKKNRPKKSFSKSFKKSFRKKNKKNRSKFLNVVRIATERALL